MLVKDIPIETLQNKNKLITTYNFIDTNLAFNKTESHLKSLIMNICA